MSKTSYVNYEGREEFTTALMETKGYKIATAKVYARALKNSSSRSHKKSIALWKELMTKPKQSVKKESEKPNLTETKEDSSKAYNVSNVSNSETHYKNKIKAIKAILGLSSNSNAESCIGLIKKVLEL